MSTVLSFEKYRDFSDMDEYDNITIGQINLTSDYCPMITLKGLIYESRTTCYNLMDFFDKRKSTCLSRFNYCPYTGKKIDWAEMKEVVQRLYCY